VFFRSSSKFSSAPLFPLLPYSFLFLGFWKFLRDGLCSRCLSFDRALSNLFGALSCDDLGASKGNILILKSNGIETLIQIWEDKLTNLGRGTLPFFGMPGFWRASNAVLLSKLHLGFHLKLSLVDASIMVEGRSSNDNSRLFTIYFTAKLARHLTLWTP